MKKLTRILCLVLCLLMLVPMAAACSKDSTYGAQINMYLSNEVYKLDPAYAYLDASAGKLLGMLYEGLMTIDEKGKLQKALLDSYTYTEDEGVLKDDPSDDVYEMVITLKASAWSDGTAVSANDFAYAWRRILDPAFDCEAAALLYDIKNAKEYKTTGISVDEVGIEPDKERLTIKFAHSIDPEEFLRKTASVALAPVRQSVTKYYDWASASSTIATNGPFMIRTYSPGVSMQLVRNSYYRRDVTDEDSTPSPTKYVKPYCINIDFQLNSEEMMKKYEDGELFYISELPMDKATRKKYKEKVELMDTLNTHTYMFNLNKEPFNNKAVRQALSLVIDRQQIVDEIVYASSATGYIPSGLNDKTDKDDFAKNNSKKLSSSAKYDDAMELLRSAGINPASYGQLELIVKVDAVATTGTDGDDTLSTTDFDTDVLDYVVAEMVVEMWNSLGFNFKVVPVNAVRYKEAESAMVQYRDVQSEKIFGIYGSVDEWVTDKTSNTVTAERAQFDVIAIDSAMLVDDAFYALAPYATKFSGSAMIGDYEDDNIYGHMSGFKNEEYDKLIEEAYEAKINGNTKVLSEKLHAAEELLLDEMPVVPIFVYKEAVLISDDLSKVEFDYFGHPIFNKVKLKNWEDYLPAEDTDEKDD